MFDFIDKSDEYLLRQISKGKHEAFDILVKRHHQFCYRLAWRSIFSKNDAEDIVQDCLLKVWQNPQAWDKTKAKFNTWLYRVVLNACYDFNRKNAKTNLTNDFNESEYVDDLSEDIGNNDEIITAIKKLSEWQQKVINLFYYEDMSTKETAEILDITPKSVEAHLSRARLSLKNLLEEFNYEITEK